MPNDDKDLKDKDDTTSDSDGQADDKGEDKDTDSDESETVSKEKYNEMVAERDNYKKGLLSKKAEDRSLEKDSDEQDDDEEGESTDSIDVTAEVDKRIDAFKDETYKSREKRAKDTFYKNHPEYVDDVTWQDFIGNDFSNKRGKATTDDILDDLEDGHLVRLRRIGKLDDYIDSQHKQGVEEGQAQANAQDAASAGGAGDQKDTGQDKPSNLTPKGENIAKGMHVDPKEAGKLDPSKDNEITLA